MSNVGKTPATATSKWRGTSSVTCWASPFDPIAYGRPGETTLRHNTTFGNQ
jgi:hypothetical protein